MSVSVGGESLGYTSALTKIMISIARQMGTISTRPFLLFGKKKMLITRPARRVTNAMNVVRKYLYFFLSISRYMQIDIAKKTPKSSAPDQWPIT